MVQEHRSLSGAAAPIGAVLLLGAALLLGGCFGPAPRPEPPPGNAIPPSPSPALPPPSPSSPAASTPPPVHAQPAPRENHLSPATRSLVTQAHSLAAHGDLDGASSTLDRALRIEPNNPLLWIELARLRLLESDAHLAEGCARKALVLASGDRDAQAQAGRALADALRAQQRNPEALEVERQPFMR
jgi:Flp pilus assembly protein TadD